MDSTHSESLLVVLQGSKWVFPRYSTREDASEYMHLVVDYLNSTSLLLLHTRRCGSAVYIMCVVATRGQEDDVPILRKTMTYL